VGKAGDTNYKGGQVGVNLSLTGASSIAGYGNTTSLTSAYTFQFISNWANDPSKASSSGVNNPNSPQTIGNQGTYTSNPSSEPTIAGWEAVSVTFTTSAADTPITIKLADAGYVLTNVNGSLNFNEELANITQSSNVSIANVGVDVPEPSTYMAMAIGLALLLGIGHLRQKLHCS
jgi:hypothetical protein